jgi:hypothetical protein
LVYQTCPIKMAVVGKYLRSTSKEQL